MLIPVTSVSSSQLSTLLSILYSHYVLQSIQYSMNSPKNLNTKNSDFIPSFLRILPPSRRDGLQQNLNVGMFVEESSVETQQSSWNI